MGVVNNNDSVPCEWNWAANSKITLGSPGVALSSPRLPANTSIQTNTTVLALAGQAWNTIKHSTFDFIVLKASPNFNLTFK